MLVVALAANQMVALMSTVRMVLAEGRTLAANQAVRANQTVRMVLVARPTPAANAPLGANKTTPVASQELAATAPLGAVWAASLAVLPSNQALAARNPLAASEVLAAEAASSRA